MRNTIVIGMLLLLASRSLGAEESSLRDSSRIAASRQTHSAGADPSPLAEAAWFWTGLALIGGGAALLISGHPPSNACSYDGSNVSCMSWRPLGAALAGTGGLTLAIGAHRRRAHAVTVTARSVTVGVRF